MDIGVRKHDMKTTTTIFIITTIIIIQFTQTILQSTQTCSSELKHFKTLKPFSLSKLEQGLFIIIIKSQSIERMMNYVFKY